MLKDNKIIILAYISALLGVCGHASSEFFVKLSGISGVEVSVWRFGLGGLALLFLCIFIPNSRNLIEPLRKSPFPIILLSIFGMAFGQFLFHWALDFATVVQVATMVTIMPIGVVFVARIVEKTRITTPKIISGIGAFLG
jgi:drug/metabolite transporter (DMT)-like permease